MDDYVVEWSLLSVPQRYNWEKYPWLPPFADATTAVQKAEEVANEWMEGKHSLYKFRVRCTTTEFIEIKV